MSLQTLQFGIEAIERGSIAEGVRLIKIALDSPDLPSNLRAIAHLWLAETQDDPNYKRKCYSDALNADPQCEEASKRLSALLTVALPPAPDFTPTDSQPLPPAPPTT
ncbi:MAG: hypothetical protein GYB67_00805, partial [Chloroflexi bacterium]|nr:hypothetical protein [Chloroflexota bacterium]